MKKNTPAREKEAALGKEDSRAKGASPDKAAQRVIKPTPKKSSSPTVLTVPTEKTAPAKAATIVQAASTNRASSGKAVLRTGLAFLFLLLVWQFISALRPEIVPPPGTVFSVWLKLLGKGTLFLHVGATAGRTAGAIALTTLLAVPTAIIAGRSERVRKITAPLAYLLYPIPKVALLPVIMLLFGLGNRAKIVLLVLILFFQMFITLRDGIAAIPRAPFTTLESFGAGKWAIFRFVILPAGLPRYLTSLRIGTGTSLAALFFSETFATRYGLGFFIMDSWMRVNYPEMFAGILSMAVLGYLLFLGIDLLERIFVPWKALA